MGICIGRSNFKKINQVINIESEKENNNNNNNNETSKISKEKNKTTTRNKNNINTDEESLQKNIDERIDSSNNIEIILNSKEKSNHENNINKNNSSNKDNNNNDNNINNDNNNNNNDNNNNDNKIKNDIYSNNNENNNENEINLLDSKKNNHSFNSNNSNNLTNNDNINQKIKNSLSSENKSSLKFNKSSSIKKLKTPKNLAISLKSTHKLPIKDINAFKGLKELNITLIGKEETGKSAFMIKVTNNLFEKVYVPTIEQECSSKKFIYKDEEFTINFFVTSGNKEYQGDYSKIFTESAFILVFYDTSVEGSFNEAKNKLKNELKDYSFKYFDTFSNFIFVGNKIDIFPKRENIEQIKKYCEKKNFENFEISVKTGKGIKELMEFLYEKFYQLTKGI